MAERLLGNIKGKDGSPATVSFVEPVSLPSGSKPTLENLGSNTNAVLRFGIPAGSQGAPGASVIGPRGEQGLPGTDGSPGRAATINVHGTTLVDDEADVKVMNVGSENNASLHFYLKRPPEEITIDEELIENSTNPVQSKAIQEALNLKADSSSIPTKVSELTNDRSFVSETSVNVMIEDAVEAAVTAANPVDTVLSDTSIRPVQNKTITSALDEKATMTVADALDNTQTKYGEIVTLSNADREVSILLTGENIESVVLSQNFAERIPTIVSELPTEGSLDRLYLVPSSGDNYSMHIWMDVDGVEKYVNIKSGSDVDLSAYATKSESIKNITRSGTTFTATRADDTTFEFTQQDNNNTYTGTSPISVSGTSISMSNSGVSAGTYGPSSNVTGNNGNTISVPQITVNAKGIVTSVTNRTYTSVDTINQNAGQSFAMKRYTKQQTVEANVTNGIVQIDIPTTDKAIALCGFGANNIVNLTEVYPTFDSTNGCLSAVSFYFDKISNFVSQSIVVQVYLSLLCKT